MQSLHENFAPQILVFRHELPFLPILSGILFVFAVESFCFAVESFLFLSWICSAVDSFVYIPSSFLFFSLVPSIISHEIRKTWEIFWKKSIVFWKKSIVFLRISIVFWGLLSNV